LPIAFREFQTLKALSPDQVLESRVDGRYNPTALKNYYYFLIQIAHAFVQLLARGRLAGVFRRVIVSVRNLFRCLADSLLHENIPAEAVDPVHLAGIQIRFENSS